MKYNNKISYLIIFMAMILCLGAVSAHETTNDTVNLIDDEQTTVSEVINENNEILTATNEDIHKKSIAKNNNSDVKTQNKIPVYFNIILTNNIVDNSTMDIAAMDSYSGKAIPNSKLEITLPDKSKINTKTSSSGHVNVTMKLPYGNNIVKIAYPETNNYSYYAYDLNISVIKRNANMQINIDKTNSTGRVNLTIKLTDSIYSNNINNAKIMIKLSDGRTFTENTNNKAEAKYAFILGSGKNNIDIIYSGDKKYNAIKTNVTVDMGKIKNNVDYDVKLNSLYVGKTSVSVTLKDYITHKILANTPLKLKLSNGKTYSGNTDKNGVMTKTLDAPVGKNYMDIIYDGNNNYFNRTAKINFTVSKRVTNMDVSLTSFTNPKLNITLNDLILNKSVNNVPVTIALPDGNKITKNTDNKGQIIYPITVPEGSKKVYVITYKGNANLTNFTKTYTVTKDKPKIPITYNITVTNRIYKEDEVIIKVIDTQTSKTISQAPVTIQLPQKTIYAKTDSKGQIKLNTNMTPGINKIGIIYKGNSKYQNSTTYANISIIKRPSTINASIKVTDILRLNLTLLDDISKKGIPNAKIILIHPKQNVTLTTDYKGQIMEEIILPQGKAEISMQFPGNAYYSSSRVKGTNITISPLVKVATKVTLNNVTGFMGDKITLTATVQDIRSNPISMGNVVFKLNGKSLKEDNTFGSNLPTKKISVRNGKASITLTADKVLRSANNITVTYSGTGKYYKNQSEPIKPKINLKKAIITVTTSPKIQQQYQYITFTVKVNDITNKAGSKLTDHKDSYVFFKINDKTLTDSKSNKIQVKVINSTATYKYQVPRGMASINKDKTTRDYVVTAVYYNPNYSTVKNTTTFNVKKSTTKIEMTTVQYSNKTRTLKLVGNIKDYKNNNVIGNSNLNVKINGKTVPCSAKSVNYVVTDGKINLNINVPSIFDKIKSVTLKCGDRLAYTNSVYETNTISKI